jgi:EmrB/QacA subfamily drug resistance transporter
VKFATDYKWTVLSNTTLGVLMTSLDGNIVLIALPKIAADLPGTTLFDLIWVIIGYQLITASVVINFGRLGDIFGRVRLYTFGFALFTAGSALCALSTSALELITFRMIQALGGAFLFANSAAILTDAFPVNERGKALGTNQVAIVIGSVLGLVLGGVLTALWGWRSIFIVNIPIGIFATLWSHYRLKEVGTLNKGIKVDIPGNVTLVTGLATFLLGITLAALSLDLTSILLIIIGVACFISFGVIETHVSQPMFNFSLFRIRAFSGGNVAIFLNALARGSITLVLVLYLQGPSMGLDPLTAGLFLIPLSLGIAIFGPISGTLSDKHGAKWFSIGGLLVSISGLLLLTIIGQTITFWGLFFPLILGGAGFGLFASPNRATIMNSVKGKDRGIASGTSATLVNIGQMLSLCIAFAVLAANTPIADLQNIFLVGTSVANVPWIANFIDGIRTVYIWSAIFLAMAIVPAYLRGSFKGQQENAPSPTESATETAPD